MKIFKNSENFITDDDFECNLYINTFDIKQLKLTSSSPLWPFSVIINCTWRGIISKQKLRFSKIFKKSQNSQNRCSRFLNKGQHRFIIHLNFDQITYRWNRKFTWPDKTWPKKIWSKMTNHQVVKSDRSMTANYVISWPMDGTGQKWSR